MNLPDSLSEDAVMQQAGLEMPQDLRFDPSSGWIRSQLFCKRILDIVAATVLTLFLGPVLVAVSIAVWLSSPGPVLFRQKRWGANGNFFVCWKFRTMYLQPGEVRARADSPNQAGRLEKYQNDPRVTRVGKLLRKTSMDELPQLFNVLRGDMSLVGPRPLVPHMLEPYPRLREMRCRVRPGITGFWQISARHENESALQMASYDLVYLNNFSLWFDLKIVLKTPAVVLFGKGAY